MVKEKELDHLNRSQIMHELLLSLNSKGKSAHGVINEIAKKYDVRRRTLGRIWRQIRDQKKNNQVPITVNNKKKGSKGRPSIPFDEKSSSQLKRRRRQVYQHCQRPWELAKPQFADGKEKSTFESTPT